MEVYYLVRDILRDLAGELLGWAIVFLLLGVPILIVAYYSIKRGLARGGVHLNVQWNSGRRSRGVGGVVEAPGPRVSVQTAEPQVEVLDQQAIDRLLELSRQRAPLDAICRQIQPEYEQW